MSRPWKQSEDEFLIFYGRCVGHGFVCLHDLDRTPEEGRERLAWLAENKRDLVLRLEAEADFDPDTKVIQ